MIRIFYFLKLLGDDLSFVAVDYILGITALIKTLSGDN